MLNWTEKQIIILETAIKLIPENGLPAVTFKNLAKKIKVTEPAIFRHFNSKKDFIKELYIYSKELFRETVQDIISQNLPANEKLYLFFEKHLKFLEDKKGANFYLLTYSIFYNDKELMNTMEEIIAEYKSVIQKLFKNGMKNNIFKKVNIDIQADIFLGITQSLIIQYILSDKKRKFAHRAKEIFDSYIKSIIIKF